MSSQFSRSNSTLNESYRLPHISQQPFLFRTKKMSKELLPLSENINNKRQILIKCLIDNCDKSWIQDINISASNQQKYIQNRHKGTAFNEDSESNLLALPSIFLIFLILLIYILTFNRSIRSSRIFF